MKDLRDFFALKDLVYQKDPYFIPQDEEMARFQMVHDKNACDGSRIFMECDPSVARLAGFYHPDRVIDGKRAAFFGYWESVERFESCRKLFKKFEAWALKQGAQRVYGPIDGSTFGRYRLRFPHDKIKQPFTGEPYNPPYYLKYMDWMGYKVAYEYCSLFSKNRLLGIAMTVLKSIKKPLPPNLRLQRLDAQMWNRSSDSIYKLLHEVFKNNFAYEPMNRVAFDRTITPVVARLVDPNISSLIVDECERKAVGICLAFPDYSELIRQGAGPSIKAGDVSWSQHAHLLKNPRILGKTFGVLPEYRHVGLYNQMMRHISKNADGLGAFVGCLAKIGNHSMKHIRAPHDVVKYGLYAKDLT